MGVAGKALAVLSPARRVVGERAVTGPQGLQYKRCDITVHGTRQSTRPAPRRRDCSSRSYVLCNPRMSAMSAISEADAASIASEVAQGPADVIVQPAEFAVNAGANPAGRGDHNGDHIAGGADNAAVGLVPNAEAVLPAKVVDFVLKLTPEAQNDVSGVLVRQGMTSPELLQELGDAKPLASHLRNPVNVYALKAIGRLYTAKAKDAEAGVNSAQVTDSMMQKWLSEFEAKHGARVPARWLVSTKVMGRLKKDEHVREEECAYVAGSKAVKRKVKFDFESGDIEVDESTGADTSLSFPAAALLMNIHRWLMSMCIMQKISPAYAMMYIMRLLDASQTANLSTLRELDAELRLEAINRPEVLGQQLVFENSDVVTRHREAGRALVSVLQNRRPGMNGHQGNGSRVQVCKQFQRNGRCSYGNNCIYRHADTSQGGARGRSHTGGTNRKNQGGHTPSGSGDCSAGREPKREHRNGPRPKVQAIGERTPHEAAAAYERALKSAVQESHESLEGDLFDDKNYKDGGAGVLPGQDLPHEDKQDRVGRLVAKTLWEAASSSGFAAALRSVNGAPTDSQVKTLQRTSSEAAEDARKRLYQLLGATESSGRAQNQVDGALLAAVMRELGVEDANFAELLRDNGGLPVGISKEIRASPLYPRYNKKVHDPFEAIPFAQHRNYKTMYGEGIRGQVAQVIKEEESRRFIRRLTRQEALDPRRTYVRRGVVPKKDGGVRVVDDYRRSNTNLRAAVPNTICLPTTANTRRLIGELQDAYPARKWMIFEIDLQSAYRALAVDPAERVHLCFSHEDESGSTYYYENCTMPFGLVASGFWFVRYATA
ncbi:hypothetical protein FOZ62_030271, partial [Perkinsus olseni]